MRKNTLRIALLLIGVTLIIMAGYTLKKDNEKKVEKRNPTELMGELETIVKSNDYEAFKKLFMYRKGEEYSKEDFENLRKFMENEDPRKLKDTYYAYQYKDKRIAVFKMDNLGEKYYINSFVKLPSSLYYHMMGIVEPKSLESKNPIKGAISNILVATEYVNNVTWSPDESCVVFRRDDMLNECAQVYLWRIGSEVPELVVEVEPTGGDFSWSPDSQYVIVDTGTYVIRGGFLISIESSKVIKEFNYFGQICWSPDSKSFATADASKETPINEFDLVSDLVVVDSASGNKNIVVYATGEFYLNALKWDEPNTIIYEKTWIANNKKETLSYIVK